MNSLEQYTIHTFENIDYKEYEKKLNTFLADNSLSNLFCLPDFLRYHLHSDCPLIGYRFVDLIIEEKSNIICYIPGTINSKKKIFESHIGTSFSGPYFSSQLDISKKSDIIKKIINHIHSLNINKIIFRLPPSFYFTKQSHFINELEFIIFSLNFSVSNYDLNVVINLDQLNKANFISSFSCSVRRNYKTASSFHLQMEMTNDIKTFYSILVENRTKFGVKPTHSLLDLEYLKLQFPEKIKFFLLYDKGMPIAGLCSFQVTDSALNVFYFCHIRSHEKKKPVDYLLIEYIKWALKNKFNIIDLGPTNEGQKINYGLLKFKRRFNGRVAIRKKFQLLIK